MGPPAENGVGEWVRSLCGTDWVLGRMALCGSQVLGAFKKGRLGSFPFGLPVLVVERQMWADNCFHFCQRNWANITNENNVMGKIISGLK